MSYGRVLRKNSDNTWELSSGYTLVYANDRVSVVRCYGHGHLEREECGVDTSGDYDDNDVLDLAEEEGMIRKSQEYCGDYMVCDWNYYGSGDIRTFCASIKEAVSAVADIQAGYVATSEILGVRIYRYTEVCGRGYYIALDSVTIAELMGWI